MVALEAPTAMQNVADVQEREVSGAGGAMVADAGLADAGLADAGLADAGLADAGLADAGLADARLEDMAMAAPAVVMRPSAGSAVTSDRRRRDVGNVSPQLIAFPAPSGYGKAEY
jgi:methenyltetrahydromethanopterin cyclohydrolase